MDVYDSFHKMFRGSNQITFNSCIDCGGECERNKIGTLLPGEKEYMAKKMEINVLEFETQYLDALCMNDGTLIPVLKLGKKCPFLNEENEICECRNFKPVLCKIYPLIFTVEAEKINFKVDNWCKLSRKKTCRDYFEGAIPLLSSLPVSLAWFRHVASYDDLFFDYDRLERYRQGKNKSMVFSFDELLSFQKTNIIASELSTSFRQVIEEPCFKI
ncbi:MAG: YkgJ family cysteine cluster protein [Methanosarcina sp.]